MRRMRVRQPGTASTIVNSAIQKPQKLLRIGNMPQPLGRLSTHEAELPDPASGFAATLATPLLCALHRGR